MSLPEAIEELRAAQREQASANSRLARAEAALERLTIAAAGLQWAPCAGDDPFEVVYGNTKITLENDDIRPRVHIAPIAVIEAQTLTSRNER